MSIHEKAAKAAAKSDREILAAALKHAPKMQDHVREVYNGLSTTDADIALGLIIRAAAAGIMQFCHTGEEVFQVTKLLQNDLANKVADLVADGRPFGRLHS